MKSMRDILFCCVLSVMLFLAGLADLALRLIILACQRVQQWARE